MQMHCDSKNVPRGAKKKGAKESVKSKESSESKDENADATSTVAAGEDEPSSDDSDSKPVSALGTKADRKSKKMKRKEGKPTKPQKKASKKFSRKKHCSIGSASPKASPKASPRASPAAAPTQSRRANVDCAVASSDAPFLQAMETSSRHLPSFSDLAAKYRHASGGTAQGLAQRPSDAPTPSFGVAYNRHPREAVDESRSSFDRAFADLRRQVRQQEEEMRKGTVPTAAARMSFLQGRMQPEEIRNKSLNAPLPRMPFHQCSGMHQQQRQPPRPLTQQEQTERRIAQGGAIQELLGRNKSASLSHPQVMAQAYRALESCNDQPFLSAMSDATAGYQPPTRASNLMSCGNDRRYEDADMMTASDLMEQQQMQRYWSIRSNNGANMAANAGSSSSSPEASPVTHAMMTQLLNQRHASCMGSGGVKNLSASRGNVQAQLYNDINALRRRQQQLSARTGASNMVMNDASMLPEVSRSDEDGRARNYPWSVRRASAA